MATTGGPSRPARSAATSTGQRCEAHFYAGARALEQGDRAAARTALPSVVASVTARSSSPPLTLTSGGLAA